MFLTLQLQELLLYGQSGACASLTVRPEQGHAPQLTKLCLALALSKKHDFVRVRQILFQFQTCFITL